MPLTTSKTNQHLPLSHLSPSRLNQDKQIVENEQENDSPIDKLLRNISLKQKYGNRNEANRVFNNIVDGRSNEMIPKSLVSKQTDAVPIEIVDDLKKQLEDAQAQLARMDLKLTQQRVAHPKTMLAQDVKLDSDAQLRDATQQLLAKLDQVPGQADPPAYGNDARLHHSRDVSPQPLEPYPGAWNKNNNLGAPGSGPTADRARSYSGWPRPTSHEYRSSSFGRPSTATQQQSLPHQRFDEFPVPSSYASAGFEHQEPYNHNFRGFGTQFNRWPSGHTPWDATSAYARGPADFSPPITPTSLTSGNPGPAVISYPARNPGNGLSPTAAEFNADHLTGNFKLGNNPWNVVVGHTPS